MGTFYNRVTTDGTTRVTTDGTTRAIVGFELGCAIGTYSITGVAATLAAAHKADDAAGVYSITGSNANFIRNLVLNAAPGSYTLSGDAANLNDPIRVDAPGSYSITGSPAALYYDRVLGTHQDIITEIAQIENGVGTSASAISATVSTTRAGGIIVAYIATVSTVTYKTVTGVTGPGLIFAKRGSIGSLVRNESGTDYFLNIEMWVAGTPSLLSSETITANVNTVLGANCDITMGVVSIPDATTSNLYNFAQATGVGAATTVGAGPTYSTTGGGETLGLMGSIAGPVFGINGATGYIDWPFGAIGGLVAYAQFNPADVTSSTAFQTTTTSDNSFEYMLDAINLNPGTGGGVYAINGQPAAFMTDRILACAPGAYAINGDAAVFVSSAGLAAGSYSITGSAVTFLRNRAVAGAPGSYAITGDAARLVYGRVLGGVPGAYAITGDDATFIRNLVLGGEGSYAITGDSAALMYDRILGTDPGSYSISGADADFTRFIGFLFGVGSYLISGAPANLRVTARMLPAESGVYVMAGADAGLIVVHLSAPGDEQMGRGGGIPPKDPRIHHAELEFFRQQAYARNVAAMVPPPIIAHRNLTTSAFPNSRPAVVPIPPRRHK